MSKKSKSGDLTKEYFEEPEVIKEIKEKGKKIAELIRNSKHFVIFTGAGVSTAAGIPDYRGPDGAWTRAAKGLSTSGKSMFKVLPTYTHMAIMELFKAGYCKQLITQNCDGLHRRSGLSSTQVSALHGTVYTERCLGCETEFLRDFNTCNNQKMRQKTREYDHRTGRKCERCGGTLYDTIINFGEYLHPKILGRAEKNVETADVCLAMGSSLTVTPACDLPLQVHKNGGKYCIVNLQKTPHDRRTEVRVFCKCDDLMKVVMDELKLTPKKVKFNRKLRIKCEKEENEQKIRLTLSPLDDIESRTFEYIQEIWIRKNRNDEFKRLSYPFVFENDQKSEQKEEQGEQEEEEHEGEDDRNDGFQYDEIILFFYGHYEEPPVIIKNYRTKIGQEKEIDLSFSPYTNLWELKPSESSPSDSIEYENMKKREIVLEIGNTSSEIPQPDHQKKRRKMYEWELFVREKKENEDAEDSIDFVEIKLHWCYKPNEFKLTKTPFLVNNKDSTTSKVEIRVHYKRARRISNILYFLSFDENSEVTNLLTHKEIV